MRPGSVRTAEWLYLGSIVLTVALAVIGWDQAVEAGGVALAFGVNAFIVGLSLLVLLLTTRRASAGARWVLVVLTVLNLAGYLWQVWSAALASGLFGVLTSAQTALTLVSVVLLFRPQARAWFHHVRVARRGGDDDGAMLLGKDA